MKSLLARAALPLAIAAAPSLALAAEPSPLLVSPEIVADPELWSVMAGGSQDRARVACAAAECLVVWEDSRLENGQIYGIRIDKTGAPIGVSFPVALSETAWRRSPAVAYNGSEYLVAFVGDSGVEAVR